MTWEPHSLQEQFIFDLWQAESNEDRRYLLEICPDQVNADLVATLLAYANEASKMGEHRTAWDMVVISQEVAQHLEDPRLMGDCHSQAGLLYFRQGALNNARRSWEMALKSYEGADADTAKAACLTNLGIACRNLGDLTKAQDCEMQALALNRQLNLPQGEVLNLGELGLIFHEMGDTHQGLCHLEQALELGRALGYRQAEADQLGNIGVVYRDQGDITRALEHLEQALAIHRDLGDQRGEANQLGNIGVVYRDMGELSQALEHFQQALTIYRALENQQGEASALGNIGLVHQSLGALTKALTYHRQALEIDRAIGFRTGEASDLGNLGLIYWDLGGVDRALTCFEQALVIQREIGDQQGEAHTLSNIGLIYRDRRDLLKALEYLEAACAIHHSIGFRQGEASDLGNIGLVYRDLGDREKAVEYMQRALALDQEIGYRQGEAAELNNIANLYCDLGDLLTAVELQTQALTIAEALNNPDLLLRILAARGSTFRELGDHEKAYADYEACIRHIESVRGRLVGPRHRTGYFGTARGVAYQQIVLLLYRELGCSGEALEYVERSKSRTLLDQLGHTTLAVPRNVAPELLQHERELLITLRGKEVVLQEAGTDEQKWQLFIEVEEMQRQLDLIWTELDGVAPNYVALRRGTPVPLTQVRELL